MTNAGDSSPDGVVSIIPARSGSRRFPDKNIAYLGPKRLIEWVVSSALACQAISSVYVSTDSDRYAEIARLAGAVPIARPPELSTETISSEAVVSHSLKNLDIIGVRPKIAVVLQPTSPLTKTETITKAISAVVANFDTALSVFPADKKPWWALKMNPDGSLERYMAPPRDQSKEFEAKLFYPTGGVYAFKTDFFRRTSMLIGGRICGIPVNWYEAIDIDYEHDLEFANFVLEHYASDITK